MKKGKLFFFEKRKQKTFFCLALMLAGCSSADPNYYTLAAVAGAVVKTPAITIEVARPGLAGYLDRSGIVLQQTGYRLDINTMDVWAEPLADMIGRVLTQDLAQRLPGGQVFGADGAIATDPDLRVEADVQQFDASPDGTVTLAATIAIEQHHVSLSTRAVRLTTTTAPGAAALAAALSGLLGQLADQVAVDITKK